MEAGKVHEILQSVIEKEKLQGAEIKIKEYEAVNGLMSQLLRVSLKKEDKSVSLILKIAPPNPAYRKMMRILFQRETFFYADVVPRFNDLELKYTSKPMGFIAKFHKAVTDSNQEVIILEDLSPRGYIMLDRRFVFSEDCMAKVMRAFGKYHALSFALQKEDPELWASIESGVKEDVITGEVAEWFCDPLKKSTELFKNDNDKIVEKLMFLHDNFASEMKRLMRPSAKYPSVIAHMDPWCNNFLFRMKKDGSVEDVVLVDFQQAEKGSPVLDISCFLYINASVKMINNFKDILRVYHDSLKEHGNTLGCDIDEIYSWDRFMDDWKDYSRYGVYKSVMGISMNTQEPEDVKPVDREDLGSSFIIDKWNKNTVERLKGLILHADKENFL